MEKWFIFPTIPLSYFKYECSVNTIECIKLDDALKIGAMSQTKVAPSTGLVPPLLQNRVGNMPDHASPIHGVVIGELLGLAYEETVPLVTHPQLKRSRIIRH